MDPQQLQATIAAVKAGSAEGYQVLLEAYGPRLYGYFFRATSSRHDAEDMLGELMLRLIRQLKNYDDRGRFESWLFRIAANMVRDRIRRMRSNPGPVSLSVEGESGQSLADQLGGKDKPIGSGLVAGETSHEVTAALEKLDVLTREMILLRYFGELSFKELADIFQCPLGTVLARVHRGLRALRQIMGNGANK